MAVVLRNGRALRRNKKGYWRPWGLSTEGGDVSQQNENVRFVQSRNVWFHPGQEAGWDRSESS